MFYFCRLLQHRAEVGAGDLTGVAGQPAGLDIRFGRDIGRLADACFHDVGSAGGHRTLGRAEFPLSAVTPGMKPADFVQHRLMSRKLRPLPVQQPPVPAEAEGDGRDHDRDSHGDSQTVA